MALCCCECPLNLGCVDLCTEFDTTQTAPVTGEYSLKYTWGGHRFVIKNTITGGENIKFDISDLIVGLTYEAIIIKPDGTQLELTDGVINDFDCLVFKAIMETEFIS